MYIVTKQLKIKNKSSVMYISNIFKNPNEQACGDGGTVVDTGSVCNVVKEVALFL